VFNHGHMQRDFTYIDDIVEGVLRVADRAAEADPAYAAGAPDPATSNAPYRIFNIGNHQPVPLLDFIGCIEDALGLKAQMRLLPLQDGDVPATYADVSALRQWVGFTPATSVHEGVARFVEWYRAYYSA
jgi:UDP-glucuronate 4-epimerase